MQRNRSISKMIALAFMLVTTGHVYAQDTIRKINGFSLQQALDYAKQHNVQVQNALLDIKIQQQVNKNITSEALPQISGSGSVNDYLDIPTTLVPGEFAGQPSGTFLPVKFGTKWTSSGSLSFRQMLFDGRVFVALKARNGTMELSSKVEEITEENIRANIYKIYYQLIAGKTQLQLLDSNILRLEKLNHDNQVMYDNGFIEKLTIEKLTVQIANLQSARMKAYNQIQNGYNGLKVLMGMPVRDSLVLTDTLNDDQVKEGVLENNQYKYTDRRDFQVLEITNKLNAINIKQYKLSQYPTLSVIGNYGKNAQRNEFNFFKKGDWFTTSFIGLQLNIPIYGGSSTRSKIQKAKFELKKSQNQTEALKISIDSDVEEAKNNFATAIAAMDYQKKNMVLAEHVYNQTKKKFEIGTGSTSEIDDAQKELQTAQNDYISSLYDAIVAKVDFLKATGKL